MKKQDTLERRKKQSEFFFSNFEKQKREETKSKTLN